MVGKQKVKATKAKRPVSVGTQCEVGMCNPQRTQGLKTNPKKGSANTLISIKGPGLLLAGHVTKQGGSNDLTFVRLRIDGKSVIDLSFAGASNWGLTQINPYGLVLLKGGPVQNFTFGWPVPLTFKKSLELTALVKETGVVQIIANIVRGTSG
jgi:hypothetical protein